MTRRSTLGTPLVRSRLHYTNSVLYGSTQKNISKLHQKAQNLLARVVLDTQQFNSHTLLQQVHWLTIEYRINFKIANITFNTLHYSQPAYLHSLLYFHAPVRSLKVLQYQSTHRSVRMHIIRARSFSVASPKIWDSLPPALRSCNCPDTFRQQLKTHYFQQGLLSP